MKYYMIRNINTNEAWSNIWGWVSDEIEEVSIFDEHEKRNFNLPIDGRWVEI